MERTEYDDGRTRNQFNERECQVILRQVETILTNTPDHTAHGFLTDVMWACRRGSFAQTDKQYVFLRNLLMRAGVGDLDYLVNHGPEADLRREMGEADITIDAVLGPPATSAGAQEQAARIFDLIRGRLDGAA